MISFGINSSSLGKAIAVALAGVFVHAAISAEPPGSAAVSAQRLVDADKDPGNWMSHGRTYGEQRFSPLTKVTDKNVDQLGLAWTFKYDLDRVVEATPIVVDGVMYTTGAYSMVYALDAVTGTLLWKYDPEVWRGIQGTGCCDAANRGVAVWNGKVYLGVYDGRLEALDAQTGKKLWSVDTVIDHERNYTISGAPRVVKGKVIIGNGGAEFGVRGYITAYDADTGKQDWRFFTVPGDPAKGDESDTIAMIRKTWFGNQYWIQGGGGTVWDSMAYDPELDLLYIGVGNASLWNYKARSEAKGDNLFVSSIVAIKPDTGKYVWHYQTTPGDGFDFTATQTITVATLSIDGKPRKVVMQAPKNGFFYVLDAADGKFISAEKFSYVNWAKGIDKATGRPILNPDKADYWSNRDVKTVFPGSQGAHNWPPMSFSPQTGLVYIPQQVTAEAHQRLEKVAAPRKWVPNLGMETPQVPETRKLINDVAMIYRGKLQAWDPVRQKQVWEVPYDHIHNSGTLATAGNLVFQGTADGRVVAYSADKGEKLWERAVTSGVVAGPISYEVNGEQYVAFNVGWGGAFPITFGALAQRTKVLPGSRVYVFKVGATGAMPEVKRRELLAPSPPALTANAAAVAEGKVLYNENCGICHGLSAMSAGTIPDLRYMSDETHKIFQPIVYGARSNLGMPPFGGRLMPDQIDKIQVYIIARAHDLKAEMEEQQRGGIVYTLREWWYSLTRQFVKVALYFNLA